MPTTPGLGNLPGVVVEVSRITRLIEEYFVVKPLDGPTAKEVLGQLEHHDIVHFACHGSSNIFDPSESCLLFERCQPGKVEPETDPLTVGQVAQLRLLVARIAFLSGCSTAEVKVEQLADEVIHLASGFQVAGFRPRNRLAMALFRPGFCSTCRGVLSQAHSSQVARDPRSRRGIRLASFCHSDSVAGSLEGSTAVGSVHSSGCLKLLVWL